NLIAFNHVHDMPYAGIHFADCSVSYFKEHRGKEAPGFGFRWDEIGDDPLTRPSVKRFTHSRKNRITYNTVHNVMQRLEDGGAVYLGFDGGQNVVRGDLISGVRGGSPRMSGSACKAARRWCKEHCQGFANSLLRYSRVPVGSSVSSFRTAVFLLYLASGPSVTSRISRSYPSFSTTK